MNRDRRHLTAILATVLLHTAVAAVLLSLFLRFDPASEPTREWPPVDSAEILLGGEYVMTGDIAEPDRSGEPSPAETAPAEASSAQPDAAVKPAPESLVSTREPSPAKTVESAKIPQKSKADKEKEEQRLAEQKRRKQEKAREAINSRVSFGSGNGQSGQPDGNSATGAVSGVTASGLGNRQALALPQPPRGPLGKIVVSIKVDRQGNVTSASYLSGSGAAAASSKAREQCVAAARKARFSANPDAPASQNGTLTYLYK